MKVWLDYRDSYRTHASSSSPVKSVWKKKIRRVDVLFFSKDVLLAKDEYHTYFIFLFEKDWHDDRSQFWRINQADIKILYP